MILPPHPVAAGSATLTLTSLPTPSSTSAPGIDREQWSSLIGVVTAIVGNVLIAFALNMQRYAHIRLEREWQAKEKDRKRRNNSWRIEQAKTAEGRTKAGKTYHPPRHTGHAGNAATEDDPRLKEKMVRGKRQRMGGAQKQRISRRVISGRRTGGRASSS